MMDGFSYYEGKMVYIILKNKRVYSGVIYSVEDAGNGLVFINLIDKFGSRIIFTSREIEVMEEEKR